MIANLTLDQLRILTAVADTGSFSAAGRKLGRAQSAISQSIATLEEAQGVQVFDRSNYRPVLTEVGRVLTDQARLIMASASRFEALADGNRAGIEPELALAIDPVVPSASFIEHLRALNAAFPELPVSFSTEGLGSSLRRLRSGQAALAVCLLLPAVPDDVTAWPIMRIKMQPVVAPAHPLASLGRAATQSDLKDYIQLVLSDPIEPSGPNYGLASARLWRFVDLSRRLDFLKAGFGWCRMPEHLVSAAISNGELVRLKIENDTAPAEGLTIYAAQLRERVLGPAGRWLLDELRSSKN
jgi:DNA-binding transcriptional LysR family regulator